MRDLTQLRVALVHYWFVKRRGGERVVEALAELFPQADIFTLVVDRNSLVVPLQGRKITSSFLQKFPGVNRYYPKLLPLFTLSAHYVRMWDLAAASRVDYFVANSENVASRIRKHYRRDAKVINPPVQVSAGRISDLVD